MRTPAPEAFHPVIRVVARAYFRARFEGVGNIPSEGPLIIAPNHVTYADPALVVLAFQRPVYFMAWSRLFEIPLFGRLIRYLRAFPVEVEGADPVATREAVRLLEAGHALMIFPEAGLTRDGRLQPFRPGMFHLASAHKVPILPVTIIGAYEAWPAGRLLPRPGRVTVVYHRLVAPPPSPDAREVARELTRQVRAAIVSRLPPHRQPVQQD